MRGPKLSAAVCVACCTRLAQSLLVADDESGQRGVYVYVDAQPLGHGVDLDDLHGGMEDLVQVEHALLELELARLLHKLGARMVTKVGRAKGDNSWARDWVSSRRERAGGWV